MYLSFFRGVRRLLFIVPILVSISACNKVNPNVIMGGKKSSGSCKSSTSESVQRTCLEGEDRVSCKAKPIMDSITGNASIYFSFNRHGLSDEDKIALDGSIEFLKKNGELIAVIDGHADVRGTREYNLALSSKRVAAIREYMSSKGVSISRLLSKPWGKDKVLNKWCAAADCHAGNRRVDIKIFKNSS